MYAYGSKSPTYNSNENSNLYTPTVSGIESTMAWLDSLAVRHYLTVDSNDPFVGSSGFSWKKFYDEFSSISCSPSVSPPFDLEGWPMYVSGFWNQFKVASKLIGRQIGVDLDNKPYPNITSSFGPLSWSGNAMNPDFGYGTIASPRDVNTDMFDVGQIPKSYYETFIGKVEPVRAIPEPMGFRQVIGRNNRQITFFPDPEYKEMSITHRKYLQTIREDDFIAREFLPIPPFTVPGGTTCRYIDFEAAPPFDMESYNSLWGKDIGPIEWTIFYQVARYSAIYDPSTNYDLIDGGWSWDFTGEVDEASDFDGTQGPKYIGPDNVDSSGYYYDNYRETFCAVENATSLYKFRGDNTWFSHPYNTFMTYIPWERIGGFLPEVYFPDGLSYKVGVSPSGYFDANGDKTCSMSHYDKFSVFNLDGSSTYDISRRLGLHSSSNFDFKFRHHDRRGKIVENQNQKDFGNLAVDYFYTDHAFTSFRYENRYRKIVASSPLFSGGRGNNLFELPPGVNSDAYYNIGTTAPAVYGSGRFFEDLTIDDCFAPMIDDHETDSYYVSVASIIIPSGNYDSEEKVLYHSRGGNGRPFVFATNHYWPFNSYPPSAAPPEIVNVWMGQLINPVSGVMKISGVVVAEGALDQYNSESTALYGPGGVPYEGPFNLGDVNFGLRLPSLLCVDYPITDPWQNSLRYVNISGTSYLKEFHKNKFQYCSFAGTTSFLPMGTAGGGAIYELINPDIGTPTFSGGVTPYSVTNNGLIEYKLRPGVIVSAGTEIVSVNGADGPIPVFGGNAYYMPEMTYYSQFIRKDFQVQSISYLGDYPVQAHQIPPPFDFVNFVRPSSYLQCLNGFIEIDPAINLFPQSGEYPVNLGIDVETIPAFYKSFY